jgi:uncharacterized protein YaeQ
MAQGSRQHIFEIELADIDRGVYATLDLRVARHPSETAPYLVTRVLAYALEHTEGVAFSRGLDVADEPAVWVKDLTGRLLLSAEVGTPDASRLHKASKASDRVVVYCHKASQVWLRKLGAARIHNADQIKLVLLDRGFIDQVAQEVQRRTAWSLTVTEGVIYLDVGDVSLSTTPERRGISEQEAA